MKRYDVAVIGAGAGLMVLEEALQKGLSCAIVERGKFGGTCLTRGCIPSKILVYPADLIREAERAERIGLRFPKPVLDWAELSSRMWKYINYHQRIQSELQKTPQLDVYRGTAEFVSAHQLVVNDEADGQTEPFLADRIIIASGARTRVPPIEGLEKAGYITSETFFGDAFPERLWRSAIIVGAGPIGLEFGHFLSAFGCAVTLVEAAPTLATTEEPEISEMLLEQYRKNGVDVRLNQEITGVRRENMRRIVSLRDRVDGRTSEASAQVILIATGVRSNADLLKTENAGLKLDKRGYLVTDDYLATNVPGIWAIGDINGKFQFRHKANREAEVLAANLFHREPGDKPQSICYSAVPWAIFGDPQVAHVGRRESEIRADGIRYQVGVNRLSDVAKGYVMGYRRGTDDDGFVKILVDEERRILGVHIIAPHAAILIQPFVYLMNIDYRCGQPGPFTGISPDSPEARPAVSRPSSPGQNKVASTESRRSDKMIPGPFPLCTAPGSVNPIARSMVIHPALSELAAWVLENLEWTEP